MFVASGEIGKYIPLSSIPPGIFVYHILNLPEFGGVNQDIWTADTCPIFNKYGSETFHSTNPLVESIHHQLTRPDLDPARSPSPVWYDAPTSPVAQEYESGQEDDRFSFGLLSYARRKSSSSHTVKSAADLQRMLRETGARDAAGLSTLARPPSSMRLSSLVTTPQTLSVAPSNEALDEKKGVKRITGWFGMVYSIWKIFGRLVPRGFGARRGGGGKGSGAIVLIGVGSILLMYCWKKRINA